MCQAFCPASPTKVYFGCNIDSASASNGERYADSENAYRLPQGAARGLHLQRPHPAGLAPVDLALDSSLRPGDVIATTDGLVAYSGGKAAAARPRNSRRSRPIPASPPTCAPGWAR